VPRGCGVKCRQLSSLPEVPCLTEVSGRGTRDTAPAGEVPPDDPDIAGPPRCAGDESENRRHPPLSGADDFPTSPRRLEFAGEFAGEFVGKDKVPRAGGGFLMPVWF
jgi:hypothetical protein